MRVLKIFEFYIFKPLLGQGLSVFMMLMILSGIPSGCKTESTNSLRTPISRGTIRVEATVQEIKPIDKSSSNDACSENPCKALIKINEIVDTGASFNGKVDQGQVLEAFFVKTLSPTESIFPDLQRHLPGLEVGDEFQADIVYDIKSTTTSGYHVVTYAKR